MGSLSGSDSSNDLPAEEKLEMTRDQAERNIAFHCCDPKGVMIQARNSLRFDEKGFASFLAAVVALEALYSDDAMIPRRIAACLAGLSEEIRARGESAALEGDTVSSKAFVDISSRFSDAISRALWRGTERIAGFGEDPGDLVKARC